MPVHKKVDEKFFENWSPDMAYVLGFFMADGSLDVNQRGAHYFSIQIIDKKLLENIRSLLKSEHKISRRKGKGNWKDRYSLQIGRKKMCNDLRRLGVTEQKTKKMDLPEIPAKYIPDFVRGYFDGDGCVYFGRHFAKDRQKYRYVFATSFTSGYKSFLEQLHNLLLKETAIKSGFVGPKTRSYELRFSHHDSLALYNVMYNNSLCPVYLKRKKEKFEEAIDKLGY